MINKPYLSSDVSDGVKRASDRMAAGIARVVAREADRKDAPAGLIDGVISTLAHVAGNFIAAVVPDDDRRAQTIAQFAALMEKTGAQTSALIAAEKELKRKGHQS